LAAAAQLPCPGGAQAFEHEAFVRGVLIDQHEPIGSLGNDISVRHLPARNAEGVLVRLLR